MNFRSMTRRHILHLSNRRHITARAVDAARQRQKIYVSRKSSETTGQAYQCVGLTPCFCPTLVFQTVVAGNFRRVCLINSHLTCLSKFVKVYYSHLSSGMTTAPRHQDKGWSWSLCGDKGSAMLYYKCPDSLQKLKFGSICRPRVSESLHSVAHEFAGGDRRTESV